MQTGDVWHNELGSKLVIEDFDGTSFTGTYQTAVGDAPGTFPMRGVLDPRPAEGDERVISWTVLWFNENGNSHAATVWNGLMKGKGIGVIGTTWLLTSQAAESSAWASTNVGCDTFTPAKPDSDSVPVASSTRAWSHPR